MLRFGLSPVKRSVLLRPRYFSLSKFALNDAKLPGSEQNAEKPKKKPLSRLPVGGSDYSQQTLKRNPIEFLTWKAVVVFVVFGSALTYVFTNEKEKLKLRREAEQNRGVGKPLIGGPFNLVDTDNNKFTQDNLQGKFSIIYFGFTHCPDICPDELDKLGLILDGLKSKHNIDLQPIFITCDPARDSPEVIKEYLKDFHPSIIGLTGDYDNVKQCCKNYRVYFSTPRNVKPGQDYLVDHSIFFYFMDPEGEFIDVLGRQYDADQAIDKIKANISAYQPRAEREKAKQGWLGFLYK
ncbi:hypothetical protein OGAPHI_004212 [Ogataea philodendri]|uniref:Uncharacterized protein n=1 Tax=Ogataea philodendri TaxID=1378263 RepID=A0A9P8P554_9ASCO|nr:uncharacterized protein OGAPHI_004212 [Ogataea philodendri]KAH3666023.1 hypothetical protein OGAPHI_004212 [Ogataea philodendri]